jgi:NAD(P)-dependent dehydrogenase (short-subunit alcohol dehydrogenase family)
MDMAKKLEGKSAVITGATSGMALATAKLFVEEGAYVFDHWPPAGTVGRGCEGNRQERHRIA